MQTIILKSRSIDGEELQATFLPEKGMNMISYKKGNTEVIDPSTQSLFDERYAGLGALIGPHFHRRHQNVVPSIPDESLFPHIAKVKAKGVHDPFSHGIGRYAPWKAEATSNTVKATLSGKDLWNGVPLSSLEGQNFTMNYGAELTPEGLKLELSVVSDSDSLVGIHFYYHLPKGLGTVTSSVKDTYYDQNIRKKVPVEWMGSSPQQLTFNLQQPADYTFRPFPNPREGNIVLDAGAYTLTTSYSCASEENCWQLYHPEGASYVCIEPISSQDPRHPNLTVSSLKIQLQISNR